MSFWRYKLLEATVHLGVCIMLLPAAFLLLVLALQLVQPQNPFGLAALIGLPWIVASLVVSNRITTKLAKRWDQ